MPENKMPEKIEIDAKEGDGWMDYRVLNKKIRKAVAEGTKHITIRNVNGHRFIAAGIKADVELELYGDVGLDLGVFAEGPKIKVYGCSEYLLGNTLSNGEIVVYGSSWDITGMGSRGGKIFVMGNGGSRIGIHMKQFKDQWPWIIYGGTVKQFCGEYMAGGTIAVFGLDFKKAIKDPKKPINPDNIDGSKITLVEGDLVQNDLAAGIHGGRIYVRGKIKDDLLGPYASKKPITEEDQKELDSIIGEFCKHFNLDKKILSSQEFTKISPISSRPFGKAYAYTPV